MTPPPPPSLTRQLILIAVEFSVVSTLFNFFLATVFATGGLAILLAAVLCLFQMALGP